MNYEDYMTQYAKPMEWPYPVYYDREQEIETDVLILGGGPAGCMAAISAAKKGLKVALLDKAYPKRSGGGSGFDHWLNTPHPGTKILPEECVEWEAATWGGYTNGMSKYIAAREAYDTLLEIEKMGGKVRDLDDEFVGAPFRDEKTKFLFCYDYENRFHFRVWGATFKPAIFNECLRLGVRVFDRVVATSLLNEGGKQGGRVVGATGFNCRTGEFYVFKAKATIHTMASRLANWRFSTELTGLDGWKPNVTGDGPAMLLRAGAQLTYAEKSRPGAAPGTDYPAYGTGNWFNTWHPATMVDANGKEIPWTDVFGNPVDTVDGRSRPAPGQRFLGERAQTHPSFGRPMPVKDLQERIKKGEFILPLYADLASMPWYERKAIWGLMVGQEGRTKIPIKLNYEAAGFDPARHMLQSYLMLSGEGFATTDPSNYTSYFRMGVRGNSGETVHDWDMRTTLEGLYVAGDAAFAGGYWYHAATTGRYAGRKAAEYAMKQPATDIDRSQVEREKARVYAPTKRTPRKDWIDWKELRAAGARAMQNYCGGLRNEGLMQTGLKWIADLKEEYYPQSYASNPHILLRVLETDNILTCDELIFHSCLARKASSEHLGHFRQDYPEVDPPEWHKWITVWQENGAVKTGELPINFWGPLPENYEAHNPDYKGWFKKK
jgi:succinate dehydrogenase/fumarate reductase flavoprotein subunit